MLKSQEPGGWKAIVLRHLRSFMADRSGNVALMFGLCAIPFFAMAGMAIDFSRALQARSELGAALDATALALGTEVGLTEKQAKDKAQKFFEANFKSGSQVTVSPLDVSYTSGTITMKASAKVSTVIVSLIGFDDLDVSSFVEVKRASKNLEVAMVLDITESMSGDIGSLRLAAKDLVDIVVQDTQTPYFSKVALIPYSDAVNAGTYANTARGTVTRPERTTITKATKASQVVLTSAAHGFKKGDRVFITGMGGMTTLNDKFFAVGNVTADTLQLYADNTTTAVSTSSAKDYTSGGYIYCASPGCQKIRLKNVSGNIVSFSPTTCVSERIGTSAYTNDAPSVAVVGSSYTSSGSCSVPILTPMTSNKSTLKTKIDALSVSGTTAGHIGFAWGWYVLSYDFGAMFSGEGAPKPKGTKDLLKIAVLMTDGEFNTMYYNGVLSKDTINYNNNSPNRTDQNATNGGSNAQAQKLCANMKKDDIIVYTVGFGLSSSGAAYDLLSGCATTSKHFKTAENGTDLRNAFREIAIDISNLRISK